jgi:hypothetical protein
MKILSYGETFIRLEARDWIYEVYGMNPRQIKKVISLLKYSEGDAWQLLRQYPFEKEKRNGYLQRQVRRDETSIQV